MSKKRTNKLPICILDWDMCIRVQPGDDREASISHAYQCFECKKAGTYSGKLMFERDQTPKCEDHQPPVEMELVCNCG